MTGADPTITVLLADDQAMIRQALSALLQLEPDIAVVGQAGDVAETVRRLSLSVVDYVGVGLRDDATLLLIEYRGTDQPT